MNNNQDTAVNNKVLLMIIMLTLLTLAIFATLFLSEMDALNILSVCVLSFTDAYISYQLVMELKRGKSVSNK